MFPKKARVGGGGHQGKPIIPEPGLPKVSCFRKVSSKCEHVLWGRPLLRETRSTASKCYDEFGFSMMQHSRSRNNIVTRQREMKQVDAEELLLGAGRDAAVIIKEVGGRDGG
jgi:hypothetical protein